MGYKLKKSISLKVLLEEFNILFNGDDILIKGVSSLNDYEEGTLIFCNKPIDVPDGAIVVTQYEYENAIVIPSEDPRKLFVHILNWLEKNIGFDLYTSVSQIHSSVKLGQNVVIEQGCLIEKDVIIESNVVIHKGTIIKEGTRIRSCASIGSDGFGFERINGVNVRFPHLGRVILGRNVEVGACSTIARGTLSDTVISDDVKIDNLVHIAHNVKVGSGTLITACAEISGSVEIGSCAWIAPNVAIREKLKIGNDAVIGLAAVVTKSVAEGVTVAGNPARPLPKKVD